MRVVFDTNIYVSAFAIPGGKAEAVFLHAVYGRFDLFASVAILTETANVLSTKFQWSDEKVQQLLQSIHAVAVILKTDRVLKVLKDEPDNRILECAVKAEADFIVTGDRHLLALKRYGTISIVKLADFLASIENTNP